MKTNKDAIRAKKKRRKLNSEEMRLLKEKQRAIYLKQRRNIKKRQLLFQRIRGIFKLSGVLILFLTAVYLFLIPQWKLSPFIFTHYPNKNLIIENNLLTSDQHIINKLKQFKVYDKPLYLLNTRDLEVMLSELSPVKKAYIRRYWLPARLKVVIVEKQPIFVVHNSINSMPEYAITTDASRIGKEFFPLPEKYNEHTYKIILPGPETVWNKDIIEKYEHIMRIAEKATGEKIIYMDLSKPRDVFIQMTQSTIRLGEIDATVIERINRLSVIAPAVKPFHNKIEYIDLRWDKALNLKEKVEPSKTNTPPITNSENKQPEVITVDIKPEE